MDPNPQSALPLPSRPNLEYYRKQAKSLLKTYKSGEPLDDFVRKTLTAKGTLASAQFVIARRHGFESWPKFSKHIEALSRQNSPTSNFEAAADAIVNGDIATLKRLLHPKLARAVSTREHGATLLTYVAANGVEQYRQKTPANIVEIAKILLDAGAEIDAAANMYGGRCTTLGLAATSVHPERAGVQEPLLQLLLDHGARLDFALRGKWTFPAFRVHRQRASESRRISRQSRSFDGLRNRGGTWTNRHRQNVVQ